VDDAQLERSCFSGRIKMRVVCLCEQPISFIVRVVAMERNLDLIKIDADYLKYMHKIDYRISVKYNNRPFVGVITMVNGITYVLPLTSQTTFERSINGKKKRAASITTFVRDSSGKEIANILHNNMFPVMPGVYSRVIIDPELDTYESNEVRFIRKNASRIEEKAKRVYAKRLEGKDAFLHRVCCDFKKLENSYLGFKPPTSVPAIPSSTPDTL